MKKIFPVALLMSLLLWGCGKEPQARAYEKRKPHISTKVSPTLPSPEFLGEKTTVELTYRGVTGKGDDLRIGGGWGFGSARSESPFVKAVKEKAKYDLFISRNHYLYDRDQTAIEYRRKEVLHAYFDLNGDGQFTDDERLNPTTDVSEENRRGKDCTVFITPDFRVTDGFGDEVPFRVMMWVNFYNRQKTPSVTWSPMGVYEGTLELEGEPMQLYLWPAFHTRCYTGYGQSRYGLISMSQDKSDHISQSTFSSLILHNKTFYRVTLDDQDSTSHTITLSFIEDKTPRGQLQLAVKGNTGLKSQLSRASLHGENDQTIHYTIRDGIQSLPIGDYTISYGSVKYGKEKANEFLTRFRKIPSFAIITDETTTVELGQPKLKIQAVKQEERYRGDKTYRTNFSRKDTIYIDATFIGIKDESYDGFEKRVDVKDYYRYEDLKAQIKIVSSQGKTIIDEALEYG